MHTNVAAPYLRKLETPVTEIEELVEKVGLQIATKNHQIDESLEQLCKKLIPFSIEDLESLTVVPDDFIFSVPFEILRSNNQYLIEKYPISYKSANIIKLDYQTKNRKLKALCLFPNYIERKPNIVSNDGSTLEPLKYVENEKQVMLESSYLEADILEDLSASELKLILSDYSVFHFGGHAKADVSRPYLSIINEYSEQELIYSDQIEQMENNLDLVCLSACQTGLGKRTQGEGVRSLAKAFLASGAESVVYSLWNINDKSTSQIISQFYRLLGERETKDQALRNAKLHYLANASPGDRHPNYWSGLCLMGDMSALDTDALGIYGRTKKLFIVIFGLIVLSILLLWGMSQRQES